MPEPADARPAAPSPVRLSRRALLGGGLALAGAGVLAGAPRAARAAKRGGTLTVGLPQDVVSFDPHNLLFQGWPVHQSFYDTLIRYDQSLKPLPGLAERWAIAPDGQSVTLTLRRGARFHSGREVTGADVVKNFEKAADPARGFNMLPAVANVEGVTAPDPGTVLIRFKKVSPEITDLLQAMSIIDPGGMETLKNRAAGSGPFKFVEWAPGDRIVADRNPDYWGKPLPHVDRLVYKIFGDSDAMVAALQSGIIDLCTSLPPKDVARLSRDFQIVRGTPGTLTYELRINPSRPPFDRKEVRQAMQFAVDRKGIVDRVLFGVSEPTVLPFSPASPAYDRSVLARYPFDLARAKELMGRAGGAPLKAEAMVVSSYPELVGIAQVLKADLAKIGFELTINVQDPAQGSRRLLAGDFQLTPSFSGNTAKYPTRVALNSIYRGAKNPVWGDSVPKAYVDALTEANSTIDPGRQKAAFARLNAALLDESWVVSVAYRQSVFGLAKHVQGLAYTVDDMLVLEGVSLEK
jgi:peptide/nickel transport system substrate-binding protein